MSQVITGSFSETNGKHANCDYVQTLTFTRSNRDEISVAVVADGGSNKSKGRMLAQIAVNTVTSYIKRSDENSICDLLINAVQLANKLVRSSFQSTNNEGKLGCSIAIAIIVNNERLHIANVGGAQIYLVRKQKIHQLTVDHAYKNISTVLGKMDFETAACNPQANRLVWSIGVKNDIQVDVGFHTGLKVSPNSYALAQRRGKKGLPLELGDSIVVCSDGLGKTRLDGRKPLVLDREMLKVLESQTGEKGARGLVSFALGRGAADDVSAALLQLPDPKQVEIYASRPKSIWQRSPMTVGSLTAAFLTLCFATVFIFMGRQPIVEAETNSDEILPVEMAAINNEGVDHLTRQDKPQEKSQIPNTDPPSISFLSPKPIKPIENHPTPEPVAHIEQRAVSHKEVNPISEMLRPTLQPKPVGIFRLGNARNFPVVWEDQTIIASQNTEIQINHIETTDKLIHKMKVLPDDDTIRDGSIYALKGSSLEFTEVDDQIELRIFEESDLFIETGLYTAGAKIEARTPSEDVTFTVIDSCMSVVYSEENNLLYSYCFAGECQFKVGRWEAAVIPQGQRASFDPQNASLPPLFTPISMDVAQLYRDNLLLNFFNGIEDTNTCLAQYLGNMAMGKGD